MGLIATQEPFSSHHPRPQGAWHLGEDQRGVGFTRMCFLGLLPAGSGPAWAWDGGWSAGPRSRVLLCLTSARPTPVPPSPHQGLNGALIQNFCQGPPHPSQLSWYVGPWLGPPCTPDPEAPSQGGGLPKPPLWPSLPPASPHPVATSLLTGHWTPSLSLSSPSAV